MNQHSTAIIVALIGLVGVLGVAVITNFKDAPPKEQTVPTNTNQVNQNEDLPAREYTVIVDPGEEPAYDVYAKDITSNESHAELSINGQTISSQALNQGWDSEIIFLPGGTHAYKYRVSLKLKETEGVSTDSCVGLISIDGPTKLRPWIEFNDTGYIKSCDLIAW